MKESKPQSLSDDSSPSTPIEGRRRVTKACQRCRLKKCKCDGSSPCGRCKSDNAICAYGKHKKSDKTVYRKGYVQMLERQHAQLIAGVHEMYKLLQNGDGRPAIDLDLSGQNDGQPLTHQILEALGVLQTSLQDDGDDSNGEWQTFEYHPQDDGVMYNSAQHSPTLQPQYLSPIQTSKPFTAPHRPSLMERRRFKCRTDVGEMQQYNSALPQLTTLLPKLKGLPPFSADMVYPLQQQRLFPNQCSNTQAYDDTMGLGSNTPGKSELMNVDWMGMDDAFDPSPPILCRPDNVPLMTNIEALLSS